MAGGGKSREDGSKKAAGNARKAEVAAQKAAVETAKKEAAEAADWQKGAKSNSKKEAEAAKKTEAARKKAERESLLADEERNTPGRAQPKNSKTATKKTGTPSRGTLDLAQLDAAGDGSGPLATVSASGIDNALDALSLGASDGAAKVDRHPERRFKAAYAQFEKRRLAEMEADGSGQGLRLRQRQDLVRKEFERSPENPFNQVTASYDASREQVADIKAQEKSKIEARLGDK